MTAALAAVGATATGHAALVEAAHVVAAPIGAPRRLAFVSLDAGVGTTTVAEWTLRAAKSAHRVLAVDARPAQVGARFLVQGGPPPEATMRRLPQAASPAYGDGVCTLRLPQARASDWHALVAPVARHFDVLGTDWPASGDLRSAVEAARLGHTVCVVAPYERQAAERAVAFTYALLRQPGAPRPVLAFVDIAHTRSTWPSRVARLLPVPAVAFGHDRALRRGGVAGARIRRGGLLVAAAMMSTFTAARGRAS